MAIAIPESFPLTVGAHGAYEWLATEHSLDDLLRLCPELISDKYIAVTSIDSGSFYPTDEERAAGWENRHGIAYSSRIENAEQLRRNGWDEWYVFENPVDLGALAQPDKNVFEASLTAGEVYAFVNSNFGLHLPSMEFMAPYFWKQFEWIRPQTYIAESDYHLMVISADKKLFTAARQVLSGLEPSSEPA
jgi:hypothetical protein